MSRQRFARSTQNWSNDLFVKSPIVLTPPAGLMRQRSTTMPESKSSHPYHVSGASTKPSGIFKVPSVIRRLDAEAPAETNSKSHQAPKKAEKFRKRSITSSLPLRQALEDNSFQQEQHSTHHAGRVSYASTEAGQVLDTGRIVGATLPVFSGEEYEEPRPSHMQMTSAAVNHRLPARMPPFRGLDAHYDELSWSAPSTNYQHQRGWGSDVDRYNALENDMMLSYMGTSWLNRNDGCAASSPSSNLETNCPQYINYNYFPSAAMFPI